MNPRSRAPRGWNAGGRCVAGNEVARAVARDDVEPVAAEEGDARVGGAARPAREPDAGSRERPADGALGVERHELVWAGGGDVAAERRPRGVVVGAEETPRAVGVRDPGAAAGGDEDPPGSRQREEGGAGMVDADRAAHVIDERAARGAEHGSDEDNGHRDRAMGRAARRARWRGSVSANAAATTRAARSSASGAPGTSMRVRRRSGVTIHRLELVEAAPQPRVDGAPRDVQHRRDLARRVLEQVAEDDHGALIRRQAADRGEQRLLRRVGCSCRGRERRLRGRSRPAASGRGRGRSPG